jgi:hypothetical protein
MFGMVGEQYDLCYVLLRLEIQHGLYDLDDHSDALFYLEFGMK